VEIMGPDDEFERLCRAQYAKVVRTAYWMTGDREEALDLAQEALTRARERWRTVATMDRPDAWVQRVVVNLALSARRRRRLIPRLLSHRLETSVSGPEAPDPQLRGALLSLTPAQRAVIVLRFYADRSVAEVADDLGKRPGTVRALTSQGLGRLRELLSVEEVDDEARR
jgi:RNA polymerase sigma-70 factor (sigma-E family)